MAADDPNPEAAGLSYANRFAGASLRHFTESLAKSVVEVETAYCTITGEPASVVGLKETIDGTSWGYTEKLLAHWKSHLRAKLLPYAFEHLPE